MQKKKLFSKLRVLMILVLLCAFAAPAYIYAYAKSGQTAEEVAAEKAAELQKMIDDIKAATADSAMPTVIVMLDDIEGSVSKLRYTGATVTIADKNEENCIEAKRAQIKGRGNSTWSQLGDKKPYRIKFDSKQDLFGMGKAKSYVLLAEVMDYTMMRNYLAYYMGEQMEVPYTTKTQHVQLYLNGSYRGVYLLCEQTQTGKNRVDIETDDVGVWDEADCGYLIEFGGNVEVANFPMLHVDDTKNWPNGFYAEIKYPEITSITKDRMQYIKEYVNNVNKAILKKDWDKITELVDIDSFVNNFIVNEIMLSGDMGWCFYMYKPQGGKLFLGPLWDFDQSSGDSEYGGKTFENYDNSEGSEHLWFTSLIEMPEFKELVAKRFLEKTDAIDSMIPMLYEKSEEYSREIGLNNEKWQTIGSSVWRTPSWISELKTYGQNVDFLAEWLENRITWLRQDLLQ